MSPPCHLTVPLECCYLILIVIALDEMHSSAVLSLFGLFFCQVPVGVGESDARDESAPAQTSPQHAGFGSDRPSACWRLVLVVVFVLQMSSKFHPVQIFVIAKFHVTNTNNHYKYPVVVPLLHILPSAKRFLSGTTAGNRLVRITL